MGDVSERIWTPGQRAALLAIVSVLFVYLLVQYARSPAHVSDPQPQTPSRAHELADRIDPNAADVHSLAALPQLGLKRAQTIIDYRERRLKSIPDDPIVFKRLEDLLRIRGIGAATIDQLRPYLKFPTTAPTTQPV